MLRWRLDKALLRMGGIGFVVALAPLVAIVQASGGAPDAEVLPPGVAVRQGPASTTPIMEELRGGAQVEVLFTQLGPGGNWAQVTLPSGGVGFVPDTSLRRLVRPPQWRPADTSSSPPSITSRAGDGVTEVPLRRVGGVLLVVLRINNQVTTNFVVDTGASVVTISHALADRLGLEYSNNPTQQLITASGIMHSPRIVLDALHVPDDTGAGVLGVDAVVATLPGSPPEIGGLLGQSFLRHFHVTIDAERAVMRLQPVGAAAGCHR